MHGQSAFDGLAEAIPRDGQTAMIRVNVTRVDFLYTLRIGNIMRNCDVVACFLKNKEGKVCERCLQDDALKNGPD